jgi:hypothetical protein
MNTVLCLVEFVVPPNTLIQNYLIAPVSILNILFRFTHMMEQLNLGADAMNGLNGKVIF